MAEVLDGNLLIAATYTELAGAYHGTFQQTAALLMLPILCIFLYPVY